MLKEIQKVRDLVESVTYVYANTASSLIPAIKKACMNGYNDDDDNEVEAEYDFVIQACYEIEEMCNELLHNDIGFSAYFRVHKKVYQLLSYISYTTDKVLSEWITQLYNADDECCRLMFFIK